MSRRVQFDRYGPVDVLHVAEMPRPSAGEGQVLVEAAAAGINPGEIAIRDGAMEAMFPATLPSGQGSDFAGRVVETGPGVTGFAPGDELMGWSDRRSAQADHVLSDPGHLIAKPPPGDADHRDPTRWSRCVTPTPSWRAGMSTARSCCLP